MMTSVQDALKALVVTAAAVGGANAALAAPFVFTDAVETEISGSANERPRQTFADDTGLTKKDIAAVFDSLAGQIGKHLSGRGSPGIFTVPGLMKMRVVKKPARKARKGVNPFTGEEIMFKAKPASKAVKVVALKGLKDMV